MLERNLTYSCFFFLSSNKHLLSLELTCAALLLKTVCSEKMTACIFQAMLAAWTIVQMNKVQIEVNQTTKHTYKNQKMT